jgi:hypothetical protein
MKGKSVLGKDLSCISKLKLFENINFDPNFKNKNNEGLIFD